MTASALSFQPSAFSFQLLLAGPLGFEPSVDNCLPRLFPPGTGQGSPIASLISQRHRGIDLRRPEGGDKCREERHRY